MSQFIFLKGSSCEMTPYMFHDFNNNSKVTIINKILPFSGKVNRLIGDAATRFINFSLLQNLYNFFITILNPLKKLSLTEEKTYLIFLNIPARELSYKYLNNYLIKHPQCVPVMLFIDPIENYMSRYSYKLTQKIPQFLCMTYDPKDAQNYSLHHTMAIYSKYPIKEKTPSYDIYFSFTGLSRLETVCSLSEYFLSNQVNTNIIIAGEPSLEEYINTHTQGIHFLKSRKPYSEIIEDISNTNCLLEILQEGHCGSTLRYYEAICYNKKLLTNNKNIVNLPFYNPAYMKVFENLSDIDCEWIRKREPVYYGYDNRFSPNQLLNEIKDLQTSP